jgi:hypothetical protein
MNVIQVLEELFEKHSPETLMALFGAATSIALFYLIRSILNHLFGLQARSVSQEASQDQRTGILLESLVQALVTEAGHLRHTLDSLLQESLRYGQKNTQDLAALLSQSEETPGEVFRMLKPEFEHLHREIRQAEAHITAKVASLAKVPVAEGMASTSDSQEGMNIVQKVDTASQ